MSIRTTIELVCDVCHRHFETSDAEASAGSLKWRTEIVRAASVKSGWTRRPRKEGKLRSVIDVCGSCSKSR